MNSSNSSTSIEPTLDQLFDASGQTWALNYLWFYPMTILSIFGTITNIISFVIFRDKDFNTNLYSYLRVYTLNSGMICFMGLFVIYAQAYRLFPWGNVLWTHIYWLYVYCPIVVTGYLFGTFLDIYITLDRIMAFEKKVSGFFKFSPLVMMLIALAISIVIQFPWFFVFVPTSFTMTLNTGEAYQFWYGGLSEFDLNPVGSIVIFVVYGIRDLATMIAAIVLNIVSLFYFKSYMIKKVRLVVMEPAVDTLAHDTGNNSTGARIQLKQSNPLIDIRMIVPVSSTNEVNDQTVSRVRVQVAKKLETKKEQITRADQKATLMCIIMSVASIVEHLLNITANLFPYFSTSDVKFFLFWAVAMSFTAKHALNFVLFVAFNNNFQKVFLRLFRIRK